MNTCFKNWKGHTTVDNRSLKVMVLGIGFILFGIIFPSTLLVLLNDLMTPIFSIQSEMTRAIIQRFVESLFPLAGLILLLVGFFLDRRQAA